MREFMARLSTLKQSLTEVENRVSAENQKIEYTNQQYLEEEAEEEEVQEL